MAESIKEFRNRARKLQADACEGISVAVARIGSYLPDTENVSLRSAMFVVAREQSCDDWAHLENAVESGELIKVKKRARLRIALYYGQGWVIENLLTDDPDISADDFGLQIALFDKERVFKALERDPESASRKTGIRMPILHLAFSRYIHIAQDRTSDMLAIAEKLLDLGADPNDGIIYLPGFDDKLSALYGALCHSDNLELGKLLLKRDADPNDGESLYHSTELNRLDGLALLLEHGADPEGTNALARALDFNWHEAVELLLRHGASPNEKVVPHPSGQPSFVSPPLHQAARRMCDGRMIALLLDAGAEPRSLYNGHSAYSLARIYGNGEAAETLKASRGLFELNKVEEILADVADGKALSETRIREEDLTEETRYLLVNLISMPSKLEHAKRLVEIGFDFDAPDAMGVPPVHAAGWQGLPKTMAWLLSLGPDLDHLNGFGGNLLSTIIHGSENCPDRGKRDHIACARLALESGAPLPSRAIELAGDVTMFNFLSNWALSNPEQVTENGIA